MGGRQTTKKDRPTRGPKDSLALYVYCIGEREALTLLAGGASPEPIERETRLEIVNGHELAAVTSVVPLSDYNEESLPERLSDPRWITERAMRHERVVEHFAARASVIPLRFGTIYLRREGVEEMLVASVAELQATIDRLQGCDEWGINLYLERGKLLGSIEATNPRMRDASEQMAHAPPGQAYLLRKKLDVLRADEARVETKRIVTDIEHALSLVSDRLKSLRLMKDEAAAAYGEAVGRFAFLVERRRFQEFSATAERLAKKYEASGFRLELTGPWPAYNFVSG